MSQDLRPILAGWEFDPDRVQVRTIVGDDGAEKIQMRIDLGLMQMEISGRPDGERPHGHESMLEFYEAAHREAAAAGVTFSLGPEECAILMREGLQYYHRYLSAFHLERYAKADPEDEFDHFEEQRETNVEFLRDLTLEDGARTAVHKKVGPITLAQMLHEWSLHDLGHIRQVAELVRARKYLAGAGPLASFYNLKP